LSSEHFESRLPSAESGADFLKHVYNQTSRKEEEFSSLKPGTIPWVFARDEEIVQAMNRTGIQDSLLYVNIQKARKLAFLLIDEKGDLRVQNLVEAIEYLKRNFCSLGFEHYFETQRQKHFLNVLSMLREGGEALSILKGIGKPVANAHADEVIRQSLLISPAEGLTDAHAKQAVLAAWLTYLRQNVGSCFATAPAIIIHDEQPARFLTDVRDLINTGRLKRTFGGIEYSFPMSPSWGMGDLRRQVAVDQFATKIADSPGFIAALGAAQVVDPALPYEKKKEISRYGLREALKALYPGFQGGITTAEAMLKAILMYNSGLTENDLQIFHERPRDLVQQRLLNQVSKVSQKPVTRGEKIALFQQNLKASQIAFKGMTDNALLKTWEFTIASFAEGKADFAKWNLYQSLGLQTTDANGIGECMYRFLNDKLKEYKNKIQDLQSQYEMVFLQLKALEGRMKSASSESQLAWLKADYEVRYNEFLTAEQNRDALHAKAGRLAEINTLLSKFYLEKFPEYFQEIYDADMQEVAREFYDDSPAGFRLLCKHGRTNPSLWTMIYTAEQFIDSLAEFFTTTENEISVMPEIEGLRDEFSQLITELVRHLRTNEFLESAFDRIAAAHEVARVKDPLKNLEKIAKKPWAYTSGGTMGALVSCVYSREQLPTEVSKWVENENELLAFYLDTLKTLPYNTAKPYYTDPSKSMLAYSPTHAFIVKPGMSPFLHGWQEDAYTFSWIRDNFISPWKQFLSTIRLNQQMIYRLVDELAERAPGELSHLIKNALGRLPIGLMPREFREQTLGLLKDEPWLKRFDLLPFTIFEIDSVLFRLLPLFSPSELKGKVLRILERIPEAAWDVSVVSSLLDQLAETKLSRHPVLTAADLRDITKAVIILAAQSTRSPRDLHSEISIAMQKLGFCMPQPFIFADSNWVREYFGFVVNPGTEEIELWRLDYAGSSGVPIPEWKKWLNGTQKKPWGIYTRPFEYGQ